MSKIIKNEKMDEVNSNHLSQMKASIDSLIATHTADDDAHHTIPNYDADLMIGVANHEYVPCILEGCGATTYQVWVPAGIRNVGNVNATWVFKLPLPTNRGGLKLYVNASKIDIRIADANDYVNTVDVIGQDYDSQDVLDTEPANRTAQGTYPSTFAAVDCSSYANIILRCACVNDSVSDLQFRDASIRCYYDT